MENKGGMVREVWSKVLGRKAMENRQDKEEYMNRTGGNNNNNRTTSTGTTGFRKGKEPTTAAIIMNCILGKGNDIMREARRRINLNEIGINEGMKCRKAITGATVFEIAGKDREKKAKMLEDKLRETFTRREDIKVYRPVKTTEVKITNMEESTANGEIVEAIIRVGGCKFTDIKIGGMKTNGNGFATAWIRCPTVTANKMMEEGGIRIGWVKAKVALLRARPLQCYRCMQFGHVRQYCRGQEDNTDRCYRCGEKGHRAAKCGARRPRCYLCDKRGKNSEHRMGGPTCFEVRTKGWRPPTRNIGTSEGEKRNEGAKMEITEEEEEEIRPKRIRLGGDRTAEMEAEMRDAEDRDAKAENILLKGNGMEDLVNKIPHNK